MKTFMWFGFVLAALSAAGKVIQTKPGHKAKIECGVNTYKTVLEWKRGDFLIYIIGGGFGFSRKGKGDIMTRISVKRDTILEFSKVEDRDAGEFTCIVDGTHHKHTLLVVSVSVSPSANLQLGSEATMQCQVKGLDPKPTVWWERPDGSPAGSETFQLKAVASSDAGTWVCKFSHDGIEYRETIDVKVKESEPPTPTPTPPQGSTDVIKPSCQNCSTVLQPGEVRLGLGLSWWMWAAVGGGSLILVLLTVSVLVLCKRNRRRRRKFLKMKKAKHLLKAREFCQCKRPAAAAPPPQGRRREKPSAPALME